jgi:hypothetical protein
MPPTCGVADRRIVGVDPGRERLEHRELLDLLHRDDVRRAQRLADLQRELAQPAIVLVRADHLVVLGVVDRVEQAQHVLAADGELAGDLVAHRDHLRLAAGDRELGGEDLVVAEGEGQRAGGIDGGAGADADVGKTEPVGIDLEDLRVAVPDRQVGEARRQDARLAERARRAGDDGEVAELVARPGDGAAADAHPHALEALQLRGGAVGRGEGLIEVDEARQRRAARHLDRRVADLGEVEELLHRADDIDHVADLDGGGAAGEDEDALGGARVGVGVGVGRLHEEAVRGQAGDDVAQRLDRIADEGRVGAVALDVVDGDEGRLGRRLDHPAVRAQAVEGVGGEAVPLDGGIEGVGAVAVARGHRALAPQGVVGGRGEPAAPLGAGVGADLADDVDPRAALDQRHRVVAVEPAGAVRLIGLRQDGGVRRGLGEDEDVAGLDGAGEADGQAGAGVAVEEHLHLVGAGQGDRRGTRVEDLEGLVVRAALDVLGEEELAWRRLCGRLRGGERDGGEGQDGLEATGACGHQCLLGEATVRRVLRRFQM